MLQHVLLGVVAPPLLLLGLSPAMAQAIARRVPPLVALAEPVPAQLIAGLVMVAWHLPALYDLTLTNEGVHIAEHLTFMGFGLLNWWPVLSPAPEQRLSYPLQVLYLFADGMFMMVLGILFTFAPIVFYSPYASAPRLWGVSALVDQQFGGLIMWYPGIVPYGVALVIAFYRWFEGGESARSEAQRI
jgi:putative membrane protein